MTWPRVSEKIFPFNMSREFFSPFRKMGCVTLEKSPNLSGPHLPSEVDPSVLQAAVRTH